MLGAGDIEVSKQEQNQVLIFMAFLYCSTNWGRGGQQSRKQTNKIIGGNDKDHKGN